MNDDEKRHTSGVVSWADVPVIYCLISDCQEWNTQHKAYMISCQLEVYHMPQVNNIYVLDLIFSTLSAVKSNGIFLSEVHQ